MSKKAGPKTRARQEEKESSSSGGCVDSGGGACENVDSESRAGPTSSTSMLKKRRATPSMRQCLEETDSSDKCFRAFEEDVRQETGSSALAHDGYMKSVFWTV